jgi:DNA-binding MarR family transcriptional regulator
MTKYTEAKKILYNFCKKNKNLEKNEIVKHFATLGFAKRSIYRWLNCKSIERKKGSGRKAKIATKSNINKIKNAFNHRSGCSQRKAARKFGCSQSYISRILKKKSAIRVYKKQKKPFQTAEQKLSVRPKCRKMLEKYKNLEFIIDDESYFTLTHSCQPGNDRYYSSNKSLTPDNVKFYYKQKYEPKLLVYLCISPRGVSKPYFRESGLAINQEVYLENCIKPHLMPIIRQHYPQGGYVFWPDLASSHYANSVINYLVSENVNFVPKDINPASVPKARPIEDFWGNLKNKVYENDWTAKSLDHLKRRIKSCLKNIDLTFVQNHIASIHKRLDSIRRYGDC